MCAWQALWAKQAALLVFRFNLCTGHAKSKSCYKLQFVIIWHASVPGILVGGFLVYWSVDFTIAIGTFLLEIHNFIYESFSLYLKKYNYSMFWTLHLLPKYKPRRGINLSLEQVRQYLGAPTILKIRTNGSWNLAGSRRDR